jgi:parvulin-like peptidyl-prolyl cis-trans isomerase-like protein
MIDAERRRRWTLAATLLVFAAGCGRPAPPPEPKKEEAKPEIPFVERPPLPGSVQQKPDKEPDHILVQHILISYAGKLPKETRTKEERKKTADEVYKRARAGENFDALVMNYTQDQYPGKYRIANRGITPDKNRTENGPEFPRDKFNPSLSVGFEMSPGNIVFVNGDGGYDIVKRLE